MKIKCSVEKTKHFLSTGIYITHAEVWETPEIARMSDEESPLITTFQIRLVTYPKAEGTAR